MTSPYLTPLSRRRFLILSGLSASSAALAACTGNGGGTTPTAGAKTSLRYVHWWTGGDAHAATVDWMATTFRQRNPNVTLDFLGIPNAEEVRAKIQTECVAGKCPEIIHAALPQFVEAGQALDLTEWMTANSDRFVGVAQEPLKFDGKNYGWSAEYGPVPVVWNTRVLEAAGVGDVPATWDAVKAAGEKVVGQGKFLTSFGIQPNTYFYSILFPMPGAQQAMEAGDWTHDTVVAAFAKLAEILPYLPPNDVENDWDKAAKMFVSEQTAFEVNGPWTIGTEILGEGTPPDFKDVVAVSPFADTGNGTSVYVDTFTFIGASAAVAEDEAKRKAVFDLFDFWTSQEVAERFVKDAQSPMGVTTAEITPELAGSVLSSFYASIESAAKPYTITQALRAGPEYGAVEEATKALRLGQSPEQATEVFSQQMSG